MPRTPSNRVATSPGCGPLCDLFTRVCGNRQLSRWTQVENGFLDAMWRFDQNFIAGIANQGDNQNGKGDFFTDLICVLLEHCSNKALEYRPGVPGLIFPKHKLDGAYPKTGAVQILIETKMAGAPKTSRNPTQRNPLGRRGSADLDKRVKEAGLKTIDLKAERARTAGQGGGPTADFTTWLRRSAPSCYLLCGVRVLDDTDLRKVIATVRSACLVMDACGLFCYMPSGAGYVARPVPTDLELDRVLSRICDQLRVLP